LGKGFRIFYHNVYLCAVRFVFQVFFNHDTFVQDPDVPARPYRWIDAKNNAAWSQVVYGPAPFSFFSIAVMTDSFDDSGRYNKDPVLSTVFEKYSLQSEAQRLLFSEQNQAPVKPASIATMREEHHEARSWISSGLQRFREQMELLWLRQFWDVWRDRVLENRRKRQERRHDWETFRGVWNCQNVDSQKIRFSLKLVQFKKARSKRIMRKYFDKWRKYVEIRRTLHSLAK
ncbi:hypothetical protein OSTOST_18635, partial [Ostertagia ostertagi]